MRTAKEINSAWTGYDAAVAKCQLVNYGVIFIDEYGAPIDDDFLLEDLYNEYTGGKGNGKD